MTINPEQFPGFMSWLESQFPGFAYDDLVTFFEVCAKLDCASMQELRDRYQDELDGYYEDAGEFKQRQRAEHARDAADEMNRIREAGW